MGSVGRWRAGGVGVNQKITQIPRMLADCSFAFFFASHWFMEWTWETQMGRQGTLKSGLQQGTF